MKIYLAAHFPRRLGLRNLANMLKLEGHEVVSSWVFVDGSEDSSEAAAKDIADLYSADVLVYFAEPRHSPGRSFELGWAYAKGKTCIVVGDEKCVFFALPGIVRVPTSYGAILFALEHDAAVAVGAKVEVVR